MICILYFWEGGRFRGSASSSTGGGGMGGQERGDEEEETSHLPQHVRALRSSLCFPRRSSQSIFVCVDGHSCVYVSVQMNILRCLPIIGCQSSSSLGPPKKSAYFSDCYDLLVAPHIFIYPRRNRYFLRQYMQKPLAISTKMHKRLQCLHLP